MRYVAGACALRAARCALHCRVLHVLRPNRALHRAPCVSPQNFSAIVGPNGSGKSNVIDALLFVFGKRAKQIRMSKVCARAAGDPRRSVAGRAVG
jgi:ABC-type Mn2+/Zn2+ transport system ATPase subunit